MLLKINTSIILSIFFLLTSYYTEAQNISLNITGQDSLQSKIIDSIGYKKTFKDFKTLQLEVQSLTNKLQQLGYIELVTGDIKKIESQKFGLKLNLKQQFYTIYIYNYKNYFKTEELTGISTDVTTEYFTIPIPRLESTLDHLNSSIVNRGSPFATLQLKNIEKLNNNNLKAELTPTIDKKRTIDKIIVKGYEKFPKSYLKHFLKIKKDAVFNIEDLKTKTANLQSIPFASEIKPPEVLFSKDSTNVYLYLEKTKSNSFDGFLGFGTNEETNKLEFDGYLNLVLVNNLNYGESLRLNYKSDEIDQKTFNINLNLPYLFKSPIGTELELTIFKKDSTFTTAKQSGNLYYQVNPHQKIFAGIQSIQSNNLLSDDSNSLKDYSSTFYNARYEYLKNDLKNKIFPLNFALTLGFGYGSRKQENKKTTQTLGNLHLEKVFTLNKKNSFYTRVNGSILFSDDFLTNELFRFGDINSIRGFEENSIEANSLGVANTEYRYLLSQNIYIHSIIDFAYFENDISNLKEKLFGFGFGFGLITQAGLLKFNYANGKSDNQKFKLSDSKIHLSLTANF